MPEATVTLDKNRLLELLLAVEKQFAWQDFVLTRLCYDLELVKTEIQCTLLDTHYKGAKTALFQFLCPVDSISKILTDDLLETWSQEFAARKTPIVRYEPISYVVHRDYPTEDNIR